MRKTFHDEFSGDGSDNTFCSERSLASTSATESGDENGVYVTAVSEDHKMISWEEIRRHNRPDDCWVVYEGKVYDVTSFVPNHPGGRTLWWQGGGRDITILFNISHPPRVKEDTHIHKYGRYIGIADGPENEGAPEYDWSSPFWCELKEKCWAKLFDLVRGYKGYEEGKFANVTYREWDVTAFHAILTLVYLACFAFCMVLCPVAFRTVPPRPFEDGLEWTRVLVSAFLSAPLAALAGLTMHEARHRDMGVFWYSPTDLSSVSTMRYMMEHVWHHNWPNLPEKELEMDLFAYAPGLRQFPWQKHYCFHRLQWLYWPISFALVIPAFILTDWWDWYFKGRVGKLYRGYTTFQEHFLFVAGHVFVPLTLFVPVLVMELRLGQFNINDYWAQLINFLVILLGSSFWITIINVVGHLTEDELDDAKLQYKDFARTQLAHSKTHSADRMWMTWLVQGMNVQAEHHLFPTVPFKYLPALTPVVLETSKKYGVEFADPYMSFGQALLSWWRRIRRLSNPEETCEGGNDIHFIAGDDCRKTERFSDDASIPV